MCLLLGLILPVVPRVPLESPASSEMNEEEESPDADYDLEDYDSEEEKRKKKRRPPPKSSKSSGVAPARLTRSSDASNDKPFLCSGEQYIMIMMVFLVSKFCYENKTMPNKSTAIMLALQVTTRFSI